MLSEVSVFIAAGQRKMNTFVTRNTKVGNSVPVAKKTDHRSSFIDTSFKDGHSALKQRVYKLHYSKVKDKRRENRQVYLLIMSECQCLYYNGVGRKLTSLQLKVKFCI